MKAWVPLSEEEREEVEQLPPYEHNPFGTPGPHIPLMMTTSSRRTKKPLTYRQTPWGLKKLVGVTEGEWLRQWEAPIRRAVWNRDKSGRALPSAAMLSSEAGELDGYHDTPPATLVDY